MDYIIIVLGLLAVYSFMFGINIYFLYQQEKQKSIMLYAFMDLVKSHMENHNITLGKIDRNIESISSIMEEELDDK